MLRRDLIKLGVVGLFNPLIKLGEKSGLFNMKILKREELPLTSK
jgi:hypothetical protein